jgi:hypothetical protein
MEDAIIKTLKRMNSIIRKIPLWTISGIAIFPVLIITGLIINIITGYTRRFFFWIIVPSIFFEQTFESCCPAIADSLILNILFVFLSWFFIGASVGFLIGVLIRAVRFK